MNQNLFQKWAQVFRSTKYCWGQFIFVNQKKIKLVNIKKKIDGIFSKLQPWKILGTLATEKFDMRVKIKPITE